MDRLILEDELSEITGFYKKLTNAYMHPPKFVGISKKGRFLYENAVVVSDSNPLGNLMFPAMMSIKNKGLIGSAKGYSVYDGISAREVLKPYKMTLNVDVFSMEAVPVAVSFPDKLSYDYKNINYTYGEPPSTFNWKDKDSPDAEAFVDDMVHLGFRVGQNFVPELNMVVML